MSQWLVFLAVIPLCCMRLTKKRRIRGRFMWNGIAFGMVIAPVSFGLVQMTFVPCIGKLLGLVGIIFNLTHGSVGYIGLLLSGVIEPNTEITVAAFALINLFNGVLFAYIYGLIGYALDRKRTHEEKQASAHAAPLHAPT